MALYGRAHKDHKNDLIWNNARSRGVLHLTFPRNNARLFNEAAVVEEQRGEEDPDKSIPRASRLL